MSKVIILRGLPASGKTTWALNWVKEDPINRIRLNCDDIRVMFGQYWVPERERLIWDSFYSILNTVLRSGKNIVIDNTNLNPKYVKAITTLVAIYPKYVCEFNDFFDVTLEELLNRDKNREKPVGEKTIINFAEKYPHAYERI